MSELKSYNSERIYWAVEQVEQEAGDIKDLHLDDNLFYLKSEADKVIAELKKERDWLAKDRAFAYDDLEKRAQLNIKQEESICHQKYKRCLAMAKRYEDKINVIENGYIVRGIMSTCPPKCNPKFSFYKKWHERWLELAEKYKEAI